MSQETADIIVALRKVGRHFDRRREAAGLPGGEHYRHLGVAAREAYIEAERLAREAGGEIYTEHCALSALFELRRPAMSHEVARELLRRRVLTVDGYAQWETQNALDRLTTHGEVRRDGPAEAPTYEVVR